MTLPDHRRAAHVVAGLVAERLTVKAPLPGTDDYAAVRAEYESRLFDAFIGFASSSGRGGRAFRNEAGRAVTDATSAAFYRGYQDAGGEETEAEDEDWLTARQEGERGHLPGVFEWLAEAREAETITEPLIQERVERWAQSLDSIYSEGLLRGKKNQMLEWRYGDTEHCATCLKLNGQRHTAKWYLARDYIPGKPGAAMDCGGYRCQCSLLDKDGGEGTI